MLTGGEAAAVCQARFLGAISEDCQGGGARAWQASIKRLRSSCHDAGIA